MGVYAAYLNLRVTVLRAEDILRLEVPAHTIVSTATRRTVQPRAAYLWTIPCECKKPSVVTSFRITSAAIGSLGAVIRVSCESKPEPKIARNPRVRPPVDHMVEQLASLGATTEPRCEDTALSAYGEGGTAPPPAPSQYIHYQPSQSPRTDPLRTDDCVTKGCQPRERHGKRGPNDTLNRAKRASS